MNCFFWRFCPADERLCLFFISWWNVNELQRKAGRNPINNQISPCIVACSRRSDGGERCEVKEAMESGAKERKRWKVEGDWSHLSPSLAFIFSRSFLLRTAPHYLNAWNRLHASWQSFFSIGNRFDHFLWQKYRPITKFISQWVLKRVKFYFDSIIERLTSNAQQLFVLFDNWSMYVAIPKN